MAHWNLIGWAPLIGGFLFGMIAGWMQAGEAVSFMPNAAILAGLTVLGTNMFRPLWRFIRSRHVIHHRLQI